MDGCVGPREIRNFLLRGGGGGGGGMRGGAGIATISVVGPTGHRTWPCPRAPLLSCFVPCLVLKLLVSPIHRLERLLDSSTMILGSFTTQWIEQKQNCEKYTYNMRYLRMNKAHLKPLHAQHGAADVRRASHEPQIAGIGIAAGVVAIRIAIPVAPLLLAFCRSAPPRVAQAVAIHPARGILYPALCRESR